MHDDGEVSLPVINDWNSVNGCPFAAKRWVNHKNVNSEKSYEKGDFLRVWCEHDSIWCSAIFGNESCKIYQDHEKE